MIHPEEAHDWFLNVGLKETGKPRREGGVGEGGRKQSRKEEERKGEIKKNEEKRKLQFITQTLSIYIFLFNDHLLFQ